MAQVWPFLSWHAPRPLHVLVAAEQVSGSSVNFGTGAQMPTAPGTAHDWQVPQTELEQQTPSTQLPDAQSLGAEHAFPSSLRQFPSVSQVESPPHVSSCVSMTGEQVPTLPVIAQLLQEPSQAVSQQTPSMQKPLAHCAPLVQVSDSASSDSAGLEERATLSSPPSGAPPSAGLDAAPASRPASTAVASAGPQPVSRAARTSA